LLAGKDFEMKGFTFFTGLKQLKIIRQPVTRGLAIGWLTW
jgi:hypothetical protein